MSHPFTKMFDAALKKSTDQDNLVLETAEKLKEKGYRIEEIHEVLHAFHKSLIDPKDIRIAKEALEEFSTYLEE
jgi:DNA-binding transcriptional MerR regulator